MSKALQLVQATARQLQHEGKTVNLALLRGRLAGQLAGPDLFSAYQQWRNNPGLPPADEPQAQSSETTAVVAEEQLSDRLTRIEQKLDRLLQLLERPDVSG